MQKKKVVCISDFIKDVCQAHIHENSEAFLIKCEEIPNYNKHLILFNELSLDFI